MTKTATPNKGATKQYRSHSRLTLPLDRYEVLLVVDL
jgi:hypothetical protein